MIDASLAQLVTDENEVFVREGDTTLLMLGSRVRAPEGGGTKQKTDNQWLSVFLFLCVCPYYWPFEGKKGAFKGKCLPFCLPRFSEGKQKCQSSAQHVQSNDYQCKCNIP